jgi:hypothetical protein
MYIYVYVCMYSVELEFELRALPLEPHLLFILLWFFGRWDLDP